MFSLSPCLRPALVNRTFVLEGYSKLDIPRIGGYLNSNIPGVLKLFREGYLKNNIPRFEGYSETYIPPTRSEVCGGVAAVESTRQDTAKTLVSLSSLEPGSPKSYRPIEEFEFSKGDECSRATFWL